MSAIEYKYLRQQGRPVLKGTRFRLSQLIAQIAAGDSPLEIAEDFDLDFGTIIDALKELSVDLDKLPEERLQEYFLLSAEITQQKEKYEAKFNPNKDVGGNSYPS